MHLEIWYTMSTNNNNKNQGHNTLRNDVKYLDPKADVTFKLVFGEHEDLVMSLLNALLPLDEDEQITHVEYLSPEMVPENPGKKYSVVDVRCTDQKKRQFIVEMQMYWNPYFQQRVILNASKAVVKQLNKGEDYRLIQPVYCLSLNALRVFALFLSNCRSSHPRPLWKRRWQFFGFAF